MMREGKKGCTFKVNYFFDDVGKCIINDSLRGDPQYRVAKRLIQSLGSWCAEAEMSL